MSEETREQPEEPRNGDRELPPQGEQAPPVPIVEVYSIDEIVIRPEMIDRVNFTVSMGPTWTRWDFQLINAGGDVVDSWSRTPGSGQFSGIGYKYSENNLEIDPPFQDQNFTLKLIATTKFYGSASGSSSGTIPLAPSTITAEYLPGPSRLALDWQWSDSLKPSGATARFLIRYDADSLETAPDDQRQLTLTLPVTDDSSEYLSTIAAEFSYQNGKTAITSSSARAPDGGLKIIVAAPEELLAEYDQVADAVDFTWTQPTPYGVSGYLVQYSVDGGTPAQKSVSGAGNTRLSVPVSEIPGLNPDQKTPLSGQIRATGQNGATYTALGPYSANTDLLYPDKSELILTKITTYFSGTNDDRLNVTDEWEAYPGATKYTLSIGEFSSSGTGLNNYSHTVTTTSGSVKYDYPYDLSKYVYKTSVRAFNSGGHLLSNYTWVPLITSVPANVTFIYLYEPEKNDVYLQASWDPIPDATSNTLYDINYTVSGQDPIILTTEPGQTEYNSEQPAQAGVTYTIQIRARDIHTVSAKEQYDVQRYGAWSAPVSAGTDNLLARTYVFDAGGRLRRATTGKRTNVYTFDARDNLIEVEEQKS